MDKIDTIKKEAELNNKQQAKTRFIKILESSAGGNLSIASTLSGWSRQTILNWRNHDLNFDRLIQQVVSEARENIADEAEKTLLTLIKEKNVTATIFALKNLRRSHYGESQLLSNGDTHPGQVKSEEQANQLARLLALTAKYIIPTAKGLTSAEKEKYLQLNNKALTSLS